MIRNTNLEIEGNRLLEQVPDILKFWVGCVVFNPCGVTIFDVDVDVCNAIPASPNKPNSSFGSKSKKSGSGSVLKLK